MMSPVTGLAALGQKRNDDKGGGKKNATPKISPFMPGQRGMLADQLSTGFGGGQGQWARYLNEVYSPIPTKNFQPARKGGNGGNDKKKDDVVVVPVRPGMSAQYAAPQQTMQSQAMTPQQAVGLLALSRGRMY